MIYQILRLFSVFIPVKKWRDHYKHWAKNKFNTQYQLQRILTYLQNVADASSENFHLLNMAITDPKGLAMADFMMSISLRVLPKFRNIIYEIPVDGVIIDGGVNRGKFTDLCNIFGAQIVGFEPNEKLINFLRYKYHDNKNVRLIHAGLGAEAGELDFYYNADNMSDDAFSMCRKKGYTETASMKAQMIDLADFLQQEFIAKGQRIYLMKLDIEGAEFGLIEKLIEKGIHNHVDYIVCETHARFFDDGKEKLESIQRAIRENNVSNIDLDWR